MTVDELRALFDSTDLLIYHLVRTAQMA